MVILGIDPGLTGAFVALVDGVPRVWDMPTIKVGKRNHVDPAGVRDILSGFEGASTLAILESVHAMPKQGVVSVFTFGEGFGVLKGALAALEIPYDLVTPQRWKRVMLDGTGKDKGASRLAARRLWPAQSGLFNRVRDDGRADAALMAEYGRRRSFGSEQ
jgi:crossover junction endodeoxyribonuclease RuvC